MWMIGDAAACRAMGFTFICIGEVTAMLAGAFADGIEAATGFAP